LNEARKGARKGRTVRGQGVFSGQPVAVRCVPGEEGSGWRLVRVDLPGTPEIPVRPDRVIATERSTTLGEGGATVRMVEHFLAALWASGWQDARVEVRGPELPLLDGSALPWVEALGEATAPRLGPPVEAPLEVRDGAALVRVDPSEELRFSYSIDFPDPIGAQSAHFTPGRARFSCELAPARTFLFEREAEQLRAAGALAGGTLDSALVASPDGWRNPPLRFPEEPARHKLLDLVGDLALLGAIPRGHYRAHRAGHRLHVALARRLAEECALLGGPPRC
jgi:UDP-3-O-[3-hydroxymyristoyl] N-acetylglucosamine deacetylase